MCASYMIKKRNPALLGLEFEMRIDNFEQFGLDIIAPYRPAPVVLFERKVLILKTMQFSLVPRWSKEPRVKFATHNARIETLAEKPTWREAFQARHCLVPLTHFIEPIYEGAHAGNMVAFHRRSEDWLVAAGIWESWVDRSTGEVTESFAIITADPPRFIAEMGHDRCPVFLNREGQMEWLESAGQSPEQMMNVLRSKTEHIEFDVVNHRPMKPGWEKRK